MQVDLGGADRKLALRPQSCPLGRVQDCLPLPGTPVRCSCGAHPNGSPLLLGATVSSARACHLSRLSRLNKRWHMAQCNHACSSQACPPQARGAWCSGEEMRFDRMNLKRSPHRIRPLSLATRPPLIRQPPNHLSSEFAQILPCVAHVTSCRSWLAGLLLQRSRRGAGTLNRCRRLESS